MENPTESKKRVSSTSATRRLSFLPRAAIQLKLEEMIEQKSNMITVQTVEDKTKNRDLFEVKRYDLALNEEPHDQYEELFYAIERGKADQAHDIAINQLKLKPDQILKPRKGDTIMHICAEYGRTSLLRMFYEAGNNIQALNKARELPLHIAAREGCLDMVQYHIDLMKQGKIKVNFDVPMADGWTPFLYAAVNGFPSIVELLASPLKSDNIRY